MKKLTTILSISIVLMCSSVQGQTVTAGGRSVRLSSVHLAKLRSYRIEALNRSLASGVDIRNNDMADLIFKLLAVK